MSVTPPLLGINLIGTAELASSNGCIGCRFHCFVFLSRLGFAVRRHRRCRRCDNGFGLGWGDNNRVLTGKLCPIHEEHDQAADDDRDERENQAEG